MKKLMILAISAILATHVSAQEAQTRKGEVMKARKEHKLSKEECQKRQEMCIERDIRQLSQELYMSEEQTAKFAATYREFKAEQFRLAEKYKAKFAKDLNERQVEAVLRYHGHKGHKGDMRKGEGRKAQGDMRKEEFRKGERKVKSEK